MIHWSWVCCYVFLTCTVVVKYGGLQSTGPRCRSSRRWSKTAAVCYPHIYNKKTPWQTAHDTSPIRFERSGTHLHVIPPLRSCSHLPSPQYSHMFSSHCVPKNASGQRQNLVPLFICMQTPSFLQKSLHSPAGHRGAILTSSRVGLSKDSTLNLNIGGFFFIPTTETHCTGTGHPGSPLGIGRWVGCPGWRCSCLRSCSSSGRCAGHIWNQ